MKVSNGACATESALAVTVVVFVMTEVLLRVVVTSDDVAGTGTTGIEETAVVIGNAESGVMLFNQLVVPSLTTKEYGPAGADCAACGTVTVVKTVYPIDKVETRGDTVDGMVAAGTASEELPCS